MYCNTRFGVIHYEESKTVSAIVLGSHGRRNLSSALLGSVSDHVIRHAKQPVLVIKRDLAAAYTAMPYVKFVCEQGRLAAVVSAFDF